MKRVDHLHPLLVLFTAFPFVILTFATWKLEKSGEGGLKGSNIWSCKQLDLYPSCPKRSFIWWQPLQNGRGIGISLWDHPNYSINSPQLLTNLNVIYLPRNHSNIRQGSINKTPKGNLFFRAVNRTSEAQREGADNWDILLFFFPSFFFFEHLIKSTRSCQG